MIAIEDDEEQIVMALGKNALKTRMEKLGMDRVQVYQLRSDVRKSNGAVKKGIASPLSDKPAPAVTAGSSPESRTTTEKLEDFKNETPKLRFRKDTKITKQSVGKDTVELAIIEGDVLILLNGRSYATNIDNPKRATIAALQMMKKEVAKLPNGTLLTNSPTGGDSTGLERRAAVYERAGFGKIENSKMYSVVKKGKLTPLTGDQYRYLIKSGHVVR